MWVICEIPHSDGRRHQGINFKLLLYRSAAALSNLEIMPLNWQLSIENCTRITNTSKSIYIICHVFGDVASELPDRKELIKIISTRYDFDQSFPVGSGYCGCAYYKKAHTAIIV
jgi:hypothetical protein